MFDYKINDAEFFKKFPMGLNFTRFVGTILIHLFYLTARHCEGDLPEAIPWTNTISQ